MYPCIPGCPPCHEPAAHPSAWPPGPGQRCGCDLSEKKKKKSKYTLKQPDSLISCTADSFFSLSSVAEGADLIGGLYFLSPLHVNKWSFYFEAVWDRKETLERLHIFHTPRGNNSCQLFGTPLFSSVSKITTTLLPCQHHSSNYVPEILARLTV